MSDAKQIVCPKCGAINRVPLDKPAEQARCGSCKEPLFTGAPIAMDGASFERHRQRDEVPILVDCWAEWCAPCKAMAPIFAQAAERLEPRVRLAKVDTDSEQNLAMQLGIRSIPTLILYQGGQEVARHSGLMDLGSLLAWVEKSLAA